jgi:hypothetical protein
MEAKIATLYARLGPLLAREEQQTKLAPTTREEIDHHDIGARYQAFLDGGALRDLLYSLRRRQLVTGPRNTAKVAAALCWSAFGGDDFDKHATATVLDQVGVTNEDREIVARHDAFVTEATEIRSKACQAGRDQRWDFDYTPGVPFDADRQELWTTADPNARVDFVVAPAYIVGARLLIVKQVVFTDSAADPSHREARLRVERSARAEVLPDRALRQP